MESFENLCDFIQTNDVDSIINILAKLCQCEPARLINTPIGGKVHYIYIDSLRDIKEHIEDYKYTYSLLSDNCSKIVFFMLLCHRITMQTKYIDNAYISSTENQQYIDEATEESITLTVMVSKKLTPKDIREAAAVIAKQIEREDTSKLSSSSETSDSSNTIISTTTESAAVSSTASTVVEHISEKSLSLSVDLSENVPDLREIPMLINKINPGYDFFLRQYDIEKNNNYILYAVKGNQRERSNAPRVDSSYDRELKEFLSETEQYLEKLDELPLETAAELYDLLDDAAKAATLYIKEINPELRVEICDRQDEVLERVVDELPPFEHSGKPISIYSPALRDDNVWTNVELMKHVGLCGYMLAKELGGKPYFFFGSKPSDYPYLTSLPEIEMIYKEEGADLEKAYREFLLKNYSDMDVFIMYRILNPTVNYLLNYRKLRPDGKVYCGLDMNLWWMNEIGFDTDTGRDVAENVDIFATSCRTVRNAMNRNSKVHFPCRWLPNAFYNLSGRPVIADAAVKENIILTVSRIGTEQKRNHDMLHAFARIARHIPNWSMRLVGPLAPKFQPFIDNFFTEHPHLKERVIITGAIVDKAALYKEYERAKVFCLSSWFEGATNVYAEALVHGCMFVTSSIDAADDIINYGELGVKYNRADVEALSSALLKTCMAADKQGMQEHIPKALAYANRYFDWNRNAKKLAYMLYK